MKQVEIFAYQPYQPEADQEPGVTIVIKDPIPDITTGDGSINELLNRSEDRFMEQAQILFEALRNNLPGGTIDRLAGLILLHKASHFVVSDNQSRKPIRRYGNEHLSEAQRRLVELDLQKHEIEDYYERLEATLAEVAREIGIGGYFEADDGTVYKITKPDGRWTAFKDLDFVRTKREGETRGTMSTKEAEAWRSSKGIEQSAAL